MAGLNGGIMSFKYITLNLLILFVVLMIAVENYETWTQPVGLLPGPQETVKKSAPKAENPSAVRTNEEPTSLRSFIVISEKNIFSPERKDFPILTTVEKSNPVTRPQIILYGITIAGDYQSASLVQPGRSLRKGERETITLRVGEQISGYKLAKVSPDRILLDRAGDSFEVLLYDSKSPKRRGDSKTETRQALATNPVGAESKESRAPTPPRVEISNLPDQRVASQATPGTLQRSTNKVVGPITSPPSSSASMSAPTPGTPPTKLTPTQANQLLRERVRRGRAAALEELKK
jgi:type II secretory pathway component PulC